jgi:ubiquinone/menaquinone biosynthesis C-methylase UbiE
MAVYTHGHDPSVLRSHEWRTAENSAAYLLPHLRAGQHLLDVGCGPGTITVDLAQRVAPGRVTGLDNDEGVLAKAAALAADKGLDTVDFVVGDVHALDFPDASFDIVHAHQVLQHVGDPVGALRELRRVCRPDGWVAARDSDYAAFTWYPEVPGIEEWRGLYRTVARGNGGEPDAGRRLLAWAHEAGFSEVIPSASVWCYATSEKRQWWGGLWAERIVSTRIADQPVERGLSTREGLERISAAWREWSESDDGWFAVLLGEVLCRP